LRLPRGLDTLRRGHPGAGGGSGLAPTRGARARGGPALGIRPVGPADGLASHGTPCRVAARGGGDDRAVPGRADLLATAPRHGTGDGPSERGTAGGLRDERALGGVRHRRATPLGPARSRGTGDDPAVTAGHAAVAEATLLCDRSGEGLVALGGAGCPDTTI